MASQIATEGSAASTDPGCLAQAIWTTRHRPHAVIGVSPVTRQASYLCWQEGADGENRLVAASRTSHPSLPARTYADSPVSTQPAPAPTSGCHTEDSLDGTGHVNGSPTCWGLASSHGGGGPALILWRPAARRRSAPRHPA